MNDDKRMAVVAGEYSGDIPGVVDFQRRRPAWRSYGWMGPAVFLYGTLAAFVVAFVLYPSQHLVASTIDLNGFGALARSVAEGHGFSFGFGPTIRRAPLYPFLGAGFLKVFGSGSLTSPDDVAYRPMIAANCLIFGLTCLTVWAISRRLFGSRTALLTALFCPLVPQAIRYVSMTEVETIMGLFVALLVYTSLNLIERPSLFTGMWFGLTAAAATLTKPVAEYYVFLFLIAAWWYWRTRQPGAIRGLFSSPRLLASGAALACFVVALMPWTVRNIAVTNGQFRGISSDGPGSFLRGYINTEPKYFLLRTGFDNNASWEIEANAYEERFLQQYGVPFYRYSINSYGKSSVTPRIPKGVTSAQTEAQKDRLESSEVKRRLLHEPAGFLKKFVIQSATFWYLGTTRSNSLAVGGIALVVLIFAILGLVRRRNERTIAWPIVAIVLYFNAVYAVSLALGRYSAPLFPTLLVLSTAGLVSLVPRFRFREASTHHREGIDPVARHHAT